MGIAQRAGIIFIALALLASISCEEHHLGEYPEIQREQMLPPSSGTNTDVAPAATAAAPTPVDFFPEKKSP